ncbi:sensor histidine kinase [Actinophytocola xanthii]|uniref:sensor histidine kinase n=1 Tax=Actinophytocola xanthii TaxID=1912961 RepID=UPI000AABAC07|nr:sensor histidine kinase [Actinophytocola xanthii]
MPPDGPDHPHSDELSTARPAHPPNRRPHPVTWKPGGPRERRREPRRRTSDAPANQATAPLPPLTAEAARAAAFLLGLGAFGEALARVLTAGAGLQFGVFLCLLALAGTVSVGLFPPGPAALLVAAAGFLSLALPQVLTVGAAVALLVGLVRVGTVWAQALVLPFVVLAVTRPTAMTVLLGALAPAAAWAGVAARARREALLHRAARQAVAAAVVEHTARGERARIARELHDVVAHHISMIAVQAETARLTTPDLPPLGAQRFSEIGERARSGLTEMRRLLGVLRDGTETAALRPQPGLGQLVDLLDDARQSTGARLIVSGPPVPLEPGVELAAYRIVQEALTNARRHAPGAAVDVELRYGTELRVRVRDNGPGPATAAGHGLAGMRERATAVGGTLRAGPLTLGGFLVEAVLPLPAP